MDCVTCNGTKLCSYVIDINLELTDMKLSLPNNKSDEIVR